MNVDLCYPLVHSPTIFPVTVTSSIILYSRACRRIRSDVIWADRSTSAIMYARCWPCQWVAAVTVGAVWYCGGVYLEFFWQKHDTLQCVSSEMQTVWEEFLCTDGFINVQQIEVSNTLYLCLTGIAWGAIQSNPSRHYPTKMSAFILKNVTLTNLRCFTGCITFYIF